MAELVAKTYAGALFEVALEEKSIDKYLEEINFIVDSCKKNPQFYQILNTPEIKNDEKKKVIDKVFGKKINKLIINFIKILIDKRRIKNLYLIAEKFESIVTDYKGIVKVTAVTAMPLDKDDIKKLKKRLALATGKEIKLDNQIDKDLIGGILIKLGDKVIDGTVKGKLEELEKKLTQIIV